MTFFTTCSIMSSRICATGHLRAVLGGNDNRIHADGLIVLVILDRNLALAVRTQIVERAALANVGQALCQLVRQKRSAAA